VDSRRLAHGRPCPGTELQEKVKELVRLAQEQGYLTYSDIGDAFAEYAI